MRRWWLAAVLFCPSVAGPARAHESDYSYLRLQVVEERIDAEWEIHLRDARIALGLSGDREGEPAWAELRRHEAELKALLADRIALGTAAGPCPIAFAEGYGERPGGREYALLRFRATCPERIEELDIGYELLFDLDEAHRGFLAATDAEVTHVGAFKAGQQELTLHIRQLDRWRTFRDYAREGMGHIWLGIDHLLFLVALLLPAPLALGAGGWQARERFGDVFRQVVKIVTAFTLAHSFTLSLAVLGAITLPSRAVESAIAASVFAAAWNNLRPFLPGRAASMAFGFGLLHGLGFASALAQLGLPRQARGLALLAFNVGVEIGQLAIVAVVLPAGFAARRTPAYRNWALRAGSLLIAWLATVWLIERSLAIELVPWI